jgi:hypothetical protein
MGVVGGGKRTCVVRSASDHMPMLLPRCAASRQGMRLDLDLGTRTGIIRRIMPV